MATPDALAVRCARALCFFLFVHTSHAFVIPGFYILGIIRIRAWQRAPPQGRKSFWKVQTAL
jgi:hypothetical protein